MPLRPFAIVALSGCALACAEGAGKDGARSMASRNDDASDSTAHGDAGATPSHALDAATVQNHSDAAPAERGRWPLALPAGQLVDELRAEEVASMAVDLSGTLWVVSRCQGLYALAENELHRYSWVDTPLPEGAASVFVDGLNRKWFPAFRAIALLDGAEWRQFASVEFATDTFSVADDGSAWVVELETGTSRNIAPGLEVELVPPGQVSSLAAVGARSLWALIGEEVYHVEDGEWSQPANVGNNVLIRYDALRDVAWALGNEPARLRWANGTIEVERLPEQPGGGFAGFDDQGRMVLASDTEISWVGASGVEGSAPLRAFEDTPHATLDAFGNVWLVERGYRPSAIFRHSGKRLEEALPVADFEHVLAHPWRVAGYGSLLESAAVEVGLEELRSPGAELLGRKLHFAGYVESGFEWSGVNVAGESLPYWVDLAEPLGSFVQEEDWPFFVDVEVPQSDAELEPAEWDLFGFLELDACFGHLAAYTRQFWVVEAYPRSMPEEERAQVRERLLAAD